ncbi:MAG: DUF4136 domain-containing protein [Pseudomonadota bacterium]
MFRSLWIALSALVLGGCSSLAVDSDHDESANFSSYKTFAFISDSPLLMAKTVPISPLFEGRVMNATRAELTNKGYEFIEDREAADFVVSFTLGAREKIQINNYPASYRGPGGWPWGAPYYTEVDVRDYLEGTLAIDIFDVQNKSPVWHGRAVKTISAKDRRDPTSTTNTVVAAILDQFPPE